ncbi:hypothetical protein HHX47_DHR4001055 [Lentinula edodes]|nr:hypothetical protein HHX47_DHR4001055 [Lentinula edodes]
MQFHSIKSCLMYSIGSGLHEISYRCLDLFYRYWSWDLASRHRDVSSTNDVVRWIVRLKNRWLCSPSHCCDLEIYITPFSMYRIHYLETNNQQ